MSTHFWVFRKNDESMGLFFRRRSILRVSKGGKITLIPEHFEKYSKG